MRIVVITTACLLLAGCDTGDPVLEPASAPPATTAAPSPTTDDDGDFLAALIALDAGLVIDRERALIRAWDICLDIKAGKDPATVTKDAQVRFTDSRVTVSPAQAHVIVEAAKRYIC